MCVSFVIITKRCDLTGTGTDAGTVLVLILIQMLVVILILSFVQECA